MSVVPPRPRDAEEARISGTAVAARSSRDHEGVRIMPAAPISNPHADAETARIAAGSK